MGKISKEEAVQKMKEGVNVVPAAFITGGGAAAMTSHGNADPANTEPQPTPTPANPITETQDIVKEGEANKQSYVAAKKAEAEQVTNPEPEPESVQGWDIVEETPAPAAQEITSAANKAATSPENNTPEPTPAQIEAGNYKKGHVNFQGLDISIENPAGSTRKGVDEHGNEWETELAHHYGYIKGTTGKDGDHVDIFMPEDINPESNKVFVVDQKDNVTGRFDEHKVMLGFDSVQKAREGYLDNYDESGPDRIMNIREMDISEFKDWLKNGDQTKPAQSYFKASEKQTATDTGKVENVAPTQSSQGGILNISTPDSMINLPLHNFISKVRQTAKKLFSGKTYTNEGDGSEILVPWQGIKHALSDKVNKNEATIALHLDKLIESGKFNRTEPDNKNRGNIKSVHFYDAGAIIDGNKVKIEVVVREHLDGKRYYDHYEIKRSEPQGSSGESEINQRSHQPFTERSTGLNITPANSDVNTKTADIFSLMDDEGGNIDLRIFGVDKVAPAIRKLLQKVNPKANNNIAIQQAKTDLGFIRAVLASPSAIMGKVRYYIVHGKNAMLKQERLRGIIKDKTGEIFNSLNKEQASELEELEWLGDAEAVNYTESDLEEMGVSKEVKKAYLAHRKFHNQVWRMLKAHRKAYGLDTGRLEGHVPHLFENWNVYEMVDEEVEGKDGETEIVTVPGPIAGTFRSLKQATEFANTLNPQKEYLIKPKAFRLPDDMIARTVLKDSSYFKMVDTMENEFQITKDAAFDLVRGVARRKNRHRMLGSVMKREGQSGFRTENLRDILTEYYNGVARYIALDDFKARVVPKFERDFGVELGRADQATRDKNIACYIEDYINDINGVPGKLENLMNAAIMKHPFFAQHVSSQRPAIEAINKIMHVTAVCKLGLLNLSSGVVNMAQLINTFSKVPSKEFGAAFEKVISGRVLGSERIMLKRLGIEYDLGLSDTGGYSAIHKGGKIVDASLFFFRKAEYLNRAISGLAAYRTAQNQGMNNDAARIYARQIIDKTQFDYSVADTAYIFRKPVGRLLGQFKPYAIKQIEFIVGLKGAENIKFWVPMLLMAGGAGIPMIEGLSELIEWLAGTNPLTEVKEFLMKWAGDDQEKKAVARVAMYGVASVLNVDISRRVGTGDIIPKRPSDLLGPTIGSVMQFIESKDATTAVKALAPSIGNLLTAIETAANDMTVTDPYHRDREKFKASKMDVVAKAAGFRTVKESEYSDAQNITNYERQKYTKIQQKYIDKAIEALQNKDTEGFTEAITKAAERGVVIDSQDIKREFINKLLPQNIRMIRNTRKAQRADVAELNDYLDEDEEYEDEEESDD